MNEAEHVDVFVYTLNIIVQNGTVYCIIGYELVNYCVK